MPGTYGAAATVRREMKTVAKQIKKLEGRQERLSRAAAVLDVPRGQRARKAQGRTPRPRGRPRTKTA